MRYKLLGKSGLKVSELSLGTMTFGEDWGWGSGKEESRKIFDAFVSAGGNFIDTANHYTNGTSENFVGEFVKGNRQEFVITTKYSLNGRPKDPNGGGNSRKSMVQSLEASLKRLKTDYIDLYWVHAYDGLTPFEEIMRALDDQVKLGKILYVGISDTPAWVIAKANTLSILLGWTPYIAMQTQYNLIERTSERELFPMCREFGITPTSWSPLAGGILSGKYNGINYDQKRYSPDNPMSSVFLSDRNLKIAQEVIDLAHDIDKTPAQVAIRWILQKNDNTIIPIIGGRTEQQIINNLGVIKFELSQDDMQRLEDISKIQLGFPQDFLSLPFTSQLIHGETLPLIDFPQK